MDKEKALKYIQSLSEKELVDFFYEAIEPFNKEVRKGEDFELGRHCISQSIFGTIDGKTDSEHYTEFMALPSKELANLQWVKDSKTVHEQGQCKKCQAMVI